MHRLKFVLLALFSAVLLLSCHWSENSGQTASLNLTIAAREIFASALNPDEFVLAVKMTGKKYSAYKKAGLTSPKIIFPSVPLGEEITVSVVMFPAGTKTGVPLYYGIFPQDGGPRKVNPSLQSLTIELQAINPLAAGGEISFVETGGGSWDEVHTFSDTSTSQNLIFNSTPIEPIKARILVVGGGGAGGNGYGGGGGAGGLLSYEDYELKELLYTITVGAGGEATVNSGNGNKSVFSQGTGVILSVLGGGGGGGNDRGGGNNGADAPQGADIRGGGGGGGWRGVGGKSGPSDTMPFMPFGYNGGSGGNSLSGGGGGGLGSMGINGTDAVINVNEISIDAGYGGHGGSGLASDITGAVIFYAGGGGGGGSVEAGKGGKGGGGDGALGVTIPENGKDAGGPGGGGGGAAGGKGGKGGNGVVMVRFPFGKP